MPYDVYGDWTAVSDDGFSLDIHLETIAASGEVAATWSGTSGSTSCEWEFEMVSGDIDGSSIVMGPGEVISGAGCEPRPAYTVNAIEDSTTLETTLEFVPVGESTAVFTASEL
jgi:hypothetical protein